MIKFITLLCLIPTLVNCVKESDVLEKNVHEVVFNLDNKPIDLDLNWVGSVEKWYIPIWSKLYSYRIARDILQKDDICEKALQTSCLTFNRDGSILGFGKLTTFDVKSGPESMEFTTPWKKIKAKFSFKLTDNKSFVLGISSWMDGQIAWAALSTKPTMDNNTEKQIIEFIKNLGFDENLAVSNNYDKCVQEVDLLEKDTHEVIFKMNNTPLDLDLNWMGSVEKWYVPIWSKLHSFRTASDILVTDNLSEGDLKNSCLTFNRDRSVSGFGKVVNFEVNADPQSLEFTTPWKKIKARFAFKLTDNKTFILGIGSWKDGQITWAALSTKPAMDKDSEKRVLEFIKNLGLDEKLAIANNYDNCVNEGSGRSNEL